MENKRGEKDITMRIITRQSYNVFNILLHFSTILSYTVLHLLYTVRHLNLQRICNDDKLDEWMTLYDIIVKLRPSFMWPEPSTDF